MKKIVLSLCLLVGVMITVTHGQTPIVKDFVTNGLDFKPGKNRSEIIQNLGKPNSIKKEATSKDFVKTFKCTLNTLQYEGLEFTIYEGNKCLSPKIGRTVLTSNKYKVKHGIGIGASKERVISVLGKPEGIKNMYIMYSNDPEDYGNDKRLVNIYFSGNKVSKIEWIDENE